MDISIYAMQLVNLEDKADLYNYYIALSENHIEIDFEDNDGLKRTILCNIDLNYARLKLEKGWFFIDRFADEKQVNIHRALAAVGIEKFNRLYHSYYLFTHVDNLIEDVKKYIGIVYIRSCIVHPIN